MIQEPSLQHLISSPLQWIAGAAFCAGLFKIAFDIFLKIKSNKEKTNYVSSPEKLRCVDTAKWVMHDQITTKALADMLTESKAQTLLLIKVVASGDLQLDTLKEIAKNGKRRNAD